MLCHLESNIQMLMGCDFLKGGEIFYFIFVSPAPRSARDVTCTHTTSHEEQEGSLPFVCGVGRSGREASTKWQTTLAKEPAHSSGSGSG